MRRTSLINGTAFVLVAAGGLLLLLGSIALAEPKTYRGVDFPQGDASFADAVASFDPAILNEGTSSQCPGARYLDPSQALGPPDYSTGTADPGYVTPGSGGEIVLGFQDNVLTGSGDDAQDLWIFEIGPDIEHTFVWVSEDGEEWYDVGKTSGSTSGIDIDAHGFGPSERFYYVKLKDDPSQGGTRCAATVGADIDALGAITTLPNEPPTAAADSYVTTMNRELRIAAPGVLANDADPEGGTLTAAVTGQPSDGRVTMSSDGSFTYTPPPDWSGDTEFTYQACDPGDVCATATVTVRVGVPANAVDDTATTYEGTPVTIDVLGNDTGDGIALAAVDTPSEGGGAEDNADGTISYAPGRGFHGTDTFTYAIADEYGGTDTAVVTVKVKPTEPVALAISSAGGTDDGGVWTESASLGEEASLTITVTNDSPGTAFDVTLLTGLSSGTLDDSGWSRGGEDDGCGEDFRCYLDRLEPGTSASVVATIPTSEPDCVEGIAIHAEVVRPDTDEHDDAALAHITVLCDLAGPVTRGVDVPPTVAVGSAIGVKAWVDDSDTGGSSIAAAAYRLNGAGEWNPMAPADGAFDQVVEQTQATIDGLGEPDVLEICVRGTDAAGNTGPEECVLAAVYDPSAGFVTGGGWMDSPTGAYALHPDAGGRANFAFVARYRSGAQVPTGDTRFRFRAGGLDFRSSDYDWLVVSGATARYKGSGSINGDGDFGFVLTATDSDVNGGGDRDTFRLRIFDKTTDDTIYDNGPGHPIEGGSIRIHSDK